MSLWSRPIRFALVGLAALALPVTASAQMSAADSVRLERLKAEALGATVVRPAVAEPACLGAAIFAAVAAGIHPSIDAAATAMVRPAAEFAP